MPANEESIPLDMLEDSPFDHVEERPTSKRAEPVTFAAAVAENKINPLHASGDGSEERPVFGRSEFDPATSPHPFDGCCKVCAVKEPPQVTKLPSPWRNCDQRASDGRWLFRGWLPVNCCDNCYADAKKDGDTLERQRKWWLEKCPVEFRDEWDNRKGDQRLYSRVMQFNPTQGRGLLIHGQTDTGKTRAVWRLLKRLAEEGHEWLFVEAIDLLDNIPERAFSIPVLVIDDLGNDTLTAQKEVKLLKILRTRANWHRPVIITTQFVGDSLQKRFTETATAQAVIRRLRSFCDAVQATHGKA
jgi:hypothetical protein